MRILLLCFLLSHMLLLSGCWSSKEVQSINFITTLGVDYRDKQFIAYAQIVDFANIAKQEGPNQRNEGTIWVGEGKGKTLMLAIYDLYRTAQQKTLWTHVKAIVLSESVMNEKLEETLNVLLNSGELRYTPWMYGTNEDLQTLLTASSLLNQSVQSIELFEPIALYRQSSEYEPIRIHSMLDGFREPASTVLIPSVATDMETWKQESNKKARMIYFNGIYLISKKKNIGKVSGQEADGARYVSYRKMQQYPLDLQPETNNSQVMLIRNAKSSLSVASRDQHTVTFNISVDAEASVLEDKQLAPDAQLQKDVQRRIAEKIRYTFEQTKAKQMDIYSLEEHLYRKHLDLWKKLSKDKEHPVANYELGEVKVHVHLLNTTTYK
ncbi:Ger(x)C family spore germination protein [Paenibacillus provencensis]|uniref:Ger(X)C family spore germination protein n=2 Tax=Paenibacillus TaxID=44249 RepID=A0ABW3PX63_9BACL